MPKTKRKLTTELAPIDDTVATENNEEPTEYRGSDIGAGQSALSRIPAHLRSGRRDVADTSSAKSVSIEKHCENLRYKIAWTADKLADELATSVRGKAKKDQNYIKGLVWSLGVLFDKLTPVANDAVTIRVPSALLANLSAVIALQAKSKPEQLDSLSGGAVIDSTSYEPVVAQKAATPVDPAA